jgi:hypothetical protein
MNHSSCHKEQLLACLHFQLNVLAIKCIFINHSHPSLTKKLYPVKLCKKASGKRPQSSAVK